MMERTMQRTSFSQGMCCIEEGTLDRESVKYSAMVLKVLMIILNYTQLISTSKRSIMVNFIMFPYTYNSDLNPSVAKTTILNGCTLMGHNPPKYYIADHFAVVQYLASFRVQV